MTTAQQAAARRVAYQLETLWDYDYEPTHQELEALYETAKKNQWNGSTAIDWSRPIGKEGPVLNVAVAFAGTNFFTRLTEEEQKEMEVRVSAWRLSQFLHGEQGALVVCGQLVNSIPELDAKLYASTQVVDEGRHVEVFERYVKKLHKIYPIDPLLKALIDEILATNLWELKLLGMQMLIEGLAIAAFNLMRRQTGDPTLSTLLDYVLQDEGRHVNFGYFALRRSINEMVASKRDRLEDFAFTACDKLFARDEHTGFQSIKWVWTEMGWDAEKIWRDTVGNSQTTKHFNSFLFNDNLLPRLKRLGLISERVAPGYRAIGLVPPAE
ncbi:MAG: ferritin-like domain-containing protein [Candidatus Rokubacteria bacterium]|nr:ferritin-like domain-containing protein [Candidatus Rokubacteria bacterium]